MAQDDFPRNHAFGYEGEGFLRSDSGPRKPHVRGEHGTRSDEDIRADVCERLAMDERVDASAIDVNVQNGMVVLGGSVRDAGSRRRAEDVADLVIGVRDVENRLRVR